ncbi:hypothetical protein L1887_24557 [Cichorium endivia]|nr:hypothetical protein L1887_24557 [Cichorium endivia]
MCEVQSAVRKWKGQQMITAVGIGLIAISPSRRCPSVSRAAFDRRRRFCLRHQLHITPAAALLLLKTIDTLRSGVWKKKKHSDLVMSEVSDAISDTKPFM